MTAQPDLDVARLGAAAAADQVVVDAVQRLGDVDIHGDHRDAWHITDEQSAAWALAKARHTRAAAAAATAPARLQLEALEDRADTIRRGIAAVEADADRDVAFFHGRLSEWHAARFDADPKGCVSIRLPGGTLRSNAGQVRVKVDDAQAVHAADADSEFSELVVQVDRRALLAHIKQSGGVVPDGARIVAATRRFWVEQDGP